MFNAIFLFIHATFMKFIIDLLIYVNLFDYKIYKI